MNKSEKWCFAFGAEGSKSGLCGVIAAVLDSFCELSTPVKAFMSMWPVVPTRLWLSNGVGDAHGDDLVKASSNAAQICLEPVGVEVVAGGNANGIYTLNADSTGVSAAHLAADD